jgi:hypothetical protein
MENHYVYYSYEEFGRGYIGCRTCECLPENDDYLGSYHDKTFNPSNKIILETFSTREEALQAEVDLHTFYQVDKNPHFANKARQKTTGFYYSAKGVVRTEEYKKKMSERLKGRIIKPEWIAKMKENLKPAFGEDNPFYGKTHTEKTRSEIGQSLKEYYAENSHPWTGRKHSEESKVKFRERNAGENNPNYGKITSPEVRNKIGQSKVGRKLWNNGEQQKFSKECPGEGWILGGLKNKKEA